MTTPTDDPQVKDCIVIRARCCGAIVFATVMSMGERMTVEMHHAVQGRGKVEHMTTEQVRAAEWGCKCGE